MEYCSPEHLLALCTVSLLRKSFGLVDPLSPDRATVAPRSIPRLFAHLEFSGVLGVNSSYNH